MRTSCLIVAMVLAGAGVAGAQEGRVRLEVKQSPPPRMAKARYSAEKKVLQVQSLVPENVTQSYIVRAPVTVQREVDGKIIREEFERMETRQRVVTKWMPLVKEYPLDQIEVRTVTGQRTVPGELPRLFGGGLRPVVLVERTISQVDGKPVVKVEDVDPAYLQVLKESTLQVLLPPVPDLPPPPIALPGVPQGR